MGKKKSVQRQRDRRRKITDGILVVVLLFCFCVCLSESIYDGKLLSGEVLTYSGEYRLEVTRSWGRHSNTNYVFTLENGEVVSIPGSYLAHHQTLESWEGALTFRYPAYVGLGHDTHHLLALTGEDGTVFSEEEDVRGHIRLGVGIFLVLSLCCLLFPVMAAMVYLPPKIRAWKRRWRKWKRDREKMS